MSRGPDLSMRPELTSAAPVTPAGVEYTCEALLEDAG